MMFYRASVCNFRAEGDIVLAVLSVRPSVCPSICPMPALCLNELTYRHTF